MYQSAITIGNDPAAEALSTEQLLASLHHQSHHLRGRAAAELSRRYHESEHIFTELLAGVVSPVDRMARVLGLTTVSWIAAIAILENGTPEQVRQVTAILNSWEATEKEDLKYYLRHTKLKLEF